MPTLINNSNYNIYFKSCLLEDISAVGTKNFDFGTNLDVCPSPTELNANSFNLVSCGISEQPVNFNLIDCVIAGQMILKSFNGQTQIADMQGNVQFSPFNHQGQSADFRISVTVSMDTTYSNGQYSFTNFTSYPAITFEPIAYQGQSSIALLQTNYSFILDTSSNGQYSHDFILTTAEFDSLAVDAQNGQVLTAELDTQIAFNSINYHGQSSYYDLNTQSTALMDVDFYQGANSYMAISNPDLIECDAYTGQSSDYDLEIDLVLEFEAQNYTGQSFEFDLSRTLSIYPRAKHGQSSDYVLTTIDPINLDIDFPHGQAMEVDTLTEDEWHFKNYTGSLSYIDEMSVSLAMEFVAYQSTNASVDYLAYQATLDLEAYTGSNVEFDELFIHLGEELEFEFWNGQDLFVQDDIKIYQTFRTKTISVGQTLYDGLGDTGGINFCTTTKDWSKEYDFDVRSTDRNVWDFCGAKIHIQMDVDLLTNPRFDFKAYTGQSIEFAIPQKFVGFGIDDDDIRLYFTPILYLKPSDEMSFVAGNGSNMVYYHADADDFFSFNAQSCTTDLTVSSWVTYYAGQSMTVDMHFDGADWKRGFQRAGNSQVSYFEFEPNECFRFCKGYLKPTGDSTTFDFASSHNLDCYGYFSYTGTLSDVELSVKQAIPVDINYHGQVLNIIPDDYDENINLPIMRNGSESKWDNGLDIGVAQANNGQMTNITLERRAYMAGNGSSSILRHLAESAPSLRFITPTGCLDNQYIPLTDDGDLDLTYDQNGATVEFEPFWTRVEGECVDIFTYKIYFHTNIMTVGTESLCSLATESTLDLNTNNGANVVFEFD